MLNEEPLFIQPVVKLECVYRLSNRVVQPVWQPAVYTIQPFVKPVVKPVWQPVECLYTWYNRLSVGLTTGCIVYTNIYPVWQQVVSCKRGLTNNGDLVQVLLWKGSAEDTNSIDGKNFWNEEYLSRHPLWYAAYTSSRSMQSSALCRTVKWM